jgi:hypothetical protein
MNFQEKLFETSGDLRGFAAELTSAALEKVETLKGSLKVINQAGLAFNHVARRHAVRFVKQNSSLAAQVRDDVATLARTTFATLQKDAKMKSKSKPKARKRAAKSRSKAA